MHDVVRFVVLLALTVSGVQPALLLKENNGTKGASIQIVLVSVSNPHLFPVFIVIVYVPTCENDKHKAFEPDNQSPGSVEEKSFPKVPLFIVNPVPGDIDQIIFGLVVHGALLPLFSNAPILVLVIQTCVFTHAVTGSVKFATGGVETYIGTTPTEDVLQGLEATILAEKEFGYELLPSELVIPHEETEKECVTLAGGG